MKIRKDGKMTYTVLVEPELYDAIQTAKANGFNLQPLARAFIKQCVKTHETKYITTIK